MEVCFEAVTIHPILKVVSERDRESESERRKLFLHYKQRIVNAYKNANNSRRTSTTTTTTFDDDDDDDGRNICFCGGDGGSNGPSGEQCKQAKRYSTHCVYACNC